MQDLKSKIIEVADATMPGRRIGSVRPEDCTEAAKAALARLADVLPEDMGVTSVTALLAAHGERVDRRFALAFRRQGILHLMRVAE